MIAQRFMRHLASVLAAFHLLVVVQVPVAQAMVGTSEVIAEQQLQVDRQQLLEMLEDQGVKEKLATLGVAPDQVEQRINSLTAAELAQFNQQLEQAPAGGSVVGIIVLFLVIFIITDMLCATDIFSFIRCVR
ncbi:MAG TPA: PA2779 family protein [Pseudomonas sp.]|uniref:PA2779 family protein n=1 Tax=Pseudomonas sp. TaxID=306 RepID=UPI002CAE56A5|nr:PA2779 family protein [Pseudomonas sp.]HTO20623.1 PA2779 family protein [Pseudomonas sp.]